MVSSLGSAEWSFDSLAMRILLGHPSRKRQRRPGSCKTVGRASGSERRTRVPTRRSPMRRVTGLTLLALIACLAPARAEPMVEKYLFEAKLAEGEKALLGPPRQEPQGR